MKENKKYLTYKLKSVATKHLPRIEKEERQEACSQRAYDLIEERKQYTITNAVEDFCRVTKQIRKSKRKDRREYTH